MTSDDRTQGHLRGRSGAHPARRPAVVARVPVLLLLPLAACTAQPGEQPGATAGPPTAVTAEQPAGAGTAGSGALPGTTGATGGAVTAEPTDAGDAAGGATAGTATTGESTTRAVEPGATATAPRVSPPPEEVVRLTAVSVRSSRDAETVRFDTAGGSPGYEVRLVDAVRIEGEPLLVEGDAVLEVVLESADPNAEEGLSEDVAVALTPDTEVVVEVRFARYLAGTVTYAVGLSAPTPFSVATDEDGLEISFPR